MIEWLWPWMALLAPLPWLIRRVAPPARSQEPALRAPFFDEWRHLSESQRGRRSGGGAIPAVSLWLLWLLLLAAAARPVWIGEPVELPNSGRDLMLAVDISGSMRIEDMQVGQAVASAQLAMQWPVASGQFTLQWPVSSWPGSGQWPVGQVVASG